MSSYIILFSRHSALLTFSVLFGDIIPILCDGLLPMLEYLSVIVCFLVVLGKTPHYIWYFNATWLLVHISKF